MQAFTITFKCENGKEIVATANVDHVAQEAREIGKRAHATCGGDQYAFEDMVRPQMPLLKTRVALGLSQAANFAIIRTTGFNPTTWEYSLIRNAILNDKRVQNAEQELFDIADKNCRYTLDVWDREATNDWY